MSADQRPPRDERIDELLADRALEALSSEEQRELERSLASNPGLDADAYDHAAAALDLALGETDFEALPDALRTKLLAAGRGVVAKRRSAHDPRREAHTDSSAQRASSRAPSAALWTGWLAIAAGLVLAFVGWWPRLKPAPTLVERRQELLEKAPDKVVVAWKPTEDPASKSVSGDLVWSNREQRGYMRFKNLPKNDPSQHQYQLWIFDAQQDPKYPIDGGVFDIDAQTGDVIIPIDPTIRVVDPKMFAVTIEKPGGVVVSGREHIVVLAQI